MHLGSALQSFAEVAAGSPEGGSPQTIFFVVGLVMTVIATVVIARVAMQRMRKRRSGISRHDSAARFGAEVLLVEAAHGILPREDRDVAEIVKKSLLRDGVRLLCCGRAKASALTIPWCTYTSPEIAHVGPYPKEADQKGIGIDTYTQELDHVDRAILFDRGIHPHPRQEGNGSNGSTSGLPTPTRTTCHECY